MVDREKPTVAAQVNDDVAAHDIGSGCLICGFDNDHGKLLLCEVCNGEYHTYCLVPPLHSIPDNEWYCDRCKHIDNLEMMVAVIPESYTSRFGEICWAQGGVGYGWWPACIYDPRLTIGAARIQAIKNLGKRHLVYFFECTEAPFEILPDSKIMRWEQGILEDCHLGKAAKTSSKGRLAAFRCALHAASIEESKPRENRLDWNHQGNQGGLTLLPSPSSSPDRLRKEEKKQKRKRMELTHSVNPEKKEPQRTGSSSTAFGADSDPSSDVRNVATRPASNEAPSSASSSNPQSEGARNGAIAAPVSSGSLGESDGDAELYCTVQRGREGSDQKTSVGFVRLQSRKKSTFAHLRRVIECDLVPDAIPSDWEWRFLLPNLGPLSIKQESKFGPLLPFLLQTSSADDVGEGTLQSPVHVHLVEKRNEI
ncbi:hypothetical protein ACA910_010691 [Epithemia clementina (nom. ined.)]